MPNHDEEKKRFYKNPREEPGKEFADSFKLFALWDDLEEAINNPKSTKSEVESLRKQYIESLKNDNKLLDKMRLEAKSRVPSLPDGAPLTETQKDKGGRPSQRDKIKEVGQSLLDRNEIDLATSQKKIADKVRKLVQKNVGTSDNRGLSDQTIRRHLKPILDARGKARG